MGICYSVCKNGDIKSNINLKNNILSNIQGNQDGKEGIKKSNIPKNKVNNCFDLFSHGINFIY